MRAKKIEERYAVNLRRIARHIGDIVRQFNVTDLSKASILRDALDRYAAGLAPFAEAVGLRMVTEVAQRDERSWQRVAAQIGKGLKEELANAPTGHVTRTLLADQVRLITSLPIEAAERVHDMTLKGITEGWRADRIAAEIMKTGDVTASRATLIARTETGRTSTLLTQARAQYVGSTEFIWRTAGDSDVRPSHRALNGKTFRWDDPPECDPPHRALPGAIWNCRCYAEPVIPD